MPDFRAIPIPGDVALFDAPSAMPEPAPKLPIGITPSYAAALERSDSRCEQVRTRDGKPRRCDHVIRYYQLFLGADGVLRCEDCCKWVKAQATPRPARRSRKK